MVQPHSSNGSKPDRSAGRQAESQAKRRPRIGEKRRRDAGAYADINNWPDFDLSFYDRATRERVALISKCAEKYLNGDSALVSVEGTAIKPRHLQKLVEKACTLRPDGGAIFGFEAFIPWKAQRARVVSEQHLESIDGSSNSYKLTALFQKHPEIKEELKAFLLAKTRPNRVSPRVIHGEFKILCKRHGLGEENYPFNTQSKGKDAIVNWYRKSFIPEHYDEYIAAEFGPDAQTSNEHSNGDGQSETPAPPFAYWVLDSTPWDIHCKLELPDAQGIPEELEISRGTILRLICRNPTVNLSWRAVFAPKVCGEDLAILFWDALNGQAAPEPTVPGCRRMPGATWPALADERFRFAVCTRLYLDNDLAHLKDEVQNIVTKLWGAEVVLGKPKDPKARADIESAFSKQTRRVIHQLPATTGSNPVDRRRKRARVTIRGKVKSCDLIHVLDTYIVNENATAAESAMYRAPLPRLIKMVDTGVLKLKHLSSKRRKAYWFSDPETCRVLDYKDSGRRPYINYKYAQYTSDRLKRLPDIGSLIVRSDPNNLQYAMAWLPDGTEFGELTALGQWGDYPNDIRIRRMYGQLKKEAGFDESAEAEPLHALFAHLKRGAPANQKMALKLAYLLDFFSKRVSEEQLASWQGNVGKSALAANDGHKSATAPAAVPAPSTSPHPAAQKPLSVPTQPVRALRLTVPRKLQA